MDTEQGGLLPAADPILEPIVEVVENLQEPFHVEIPDGPDVRVVEIRNDSDRALVVSPPPGAKFILEENMEDPNYAEIMAELAVAEKQIAAKNARIARVLRKLRGSYWFYKGFKRFAEGNMFLDEWVITRELPTNAEHRKTNELGPIKEYWQTTWHGGYESELMFDYRYVQVREDRWLKLKFNYD
jgi:hypothetical protein